MIRIINCDASDSSVGFSLSHEGQVEVENCRADRCGIGFEVRDSASLLAELGLRPDTPAADLLEVVELLASGGAQTEPVKSRVSSWLAVGADLTTVLQGIAQAAQNPGVQAIARMLGL